MARMNEDQESLKRLREWSSVKHYDAVCVPALENLSEVPADRYAAFETANFGWLMSPKNAKGSRSIVEMC